jgi:hypothetical protein
MPACSDTGIQGKLTSGLGAVLFLRDGGRHHIDHRLGWPA